MAFSGPTTSDIHLISQTETEKYDYEYNQDLKSDVREWCDPATRGAVLARRGDIGDWDTSEVTNCKELFMGHGTEEIQ